MKLQGMHPGALARLESSAKAAEAALATAAKRPGKQPQKRMYAAARNSRLTADWYAPNNSADSELVSSLTQLRARSRTLVRDASYAKRAKIVVMNNVVGTGIGMQAQVKNQRGNLIDSVNDGIETVFADWSRAENCHTGGKLHFADLERQAIGQIFEAGEIVIRKHYQAFGSSTVPLALELVEAERIADNYQVPGGYDSLLRMGIEQDAFSRPIALWLRRWHPSDVRSNTQPVDYLSRVPANQLFHLYVCDRWPQTRGEPWLHAAARRLNDMDGYSEAEIVAARGGASYMATIETPDDGPILGAEEESDGEMDFAIEPGMAQRLNPGEKLNFISPNRPNPNMDPFMRMMLREVAAGASVSYESISRDYSQSNFSSSRLALMEDRDVWRVIQQWFIRAFRCELHRDWMRAAVLARAIPQIDIVDYGNNPAKFEAVAFRPRGWSYIDPVKDVAANKEAIRGGLTSTSRVIAEYGNGADADEIRKDLALERERNKEAGIVVDTDPAVILEKSQTTPLTAQPTPSQAAVDDANDDSPESARVINLRAT